MQKETVKAGLQKVRESGLSIVGCGAGNGLNASAEAHGDADLIVVYNSGFYRTHGLGSLAGLMPYGNANDIAKQIGRVVLKTVNGKVPVLIGLCATDPYSDMEQLLKEVADMGFSGVQNFPTVGLIDDGSDFRRCLEETGMGYDHEVRMVAQASNMGLFTTPYVFSGDQAERMALAGADAIVAHLGLTVSTVQGCRSPATTLEVAPMFVRQVRDRARAVNPDVLILAHGGPLNSVEAYRYLCERVDGIDGFYGASCIERAPTFNAIADEVQRYKQTRSVKL